MILGITSPYDGVHKLLLGIAARLIDRVCLCLWVNRMKDPYLDCYILDSFVNSLYAGTTLIPPGFTGVQLHHSFLERSDLFCFTIDCLDPFENLVTLAIGLVLVTR